MVRENPFLATPAIKTVRLPACSHEEELQQSACAVVDQLFASEQTVKRTGGGSDMQPATKKSKNEAYTVDVDGGRKAMSTATTSTPEKATNHKWNLGGALLERDKLDVLKILSDNNDGFAYSLEDLEQYSGPSMEVQLNDDKDIFRTKSGRLWVSNVPNWRNLALLESQIKPSTHRPQW